MTKAVTPWRHTMLWRDLPPGGRDVTLRPDEAERNWIAGYLGVEKVVHLIAPLHVRAWLDGVEIDGRIEAIVTRICGVTLEPFDEIIDEGLLLRLVPSGSPNAPDASSPEVEIDLADEDPPDVVEGDTFDLAQVVAEHSALALKPFPRRPDAEFRPPAEPDMTSPFAALARLHPPKARE